MDKIKKAVIMVGVQGSGKSTIAKTFYDGYEVIERDTIRVDIAGSLRAFQNLQDPKKEEAVTTIHELKILTASSCNKNIVIADTNINKKTRHKLVKKLIDMGYSVEYHIVDVCLNVLMERNKTRPEDDRVPVHVIQSFYERFQEQREDIYKEAMQLLVTKGISHEVVAI